MTRAAPAPRWPVALAFALPLLGLWLQGRHGLNLFDEGFLWYGAQRVLAGEVPLRDFQSYDIGRYYWSAAWMALASSDGVLALRFGNAVLAGCSVALVALLLRSGPRQPAWHIVLALVTFTAWMVPDFKAADGFAALLLAFGLARALAPHSTQRHWLGLGACLGLASVIGINHALYGVVAIALALLLSLLPRHATADGALPLVRRIAWLVLGAALGYAPVLAFHAAVPGFSDAFVDSLRRLSEIGTTNLELAMPRLGAVLFPEGRRPGHALRESLRALLFVLGPLFVLLCAWRVLRRPAADRAPPAPVFVAAVLLSVPYAHYAYSRFDVVHIAIWILPLMLALWTYPARRPDALSWRAAPIAVALVSALLVTPEQRGWQALRDGRAGLLAQVDIHGETLWLDRATAAEVALIQRLTDAHARDGRSFYATPYWPGAYAAMRRRAPTWEIYALFPAALERQQREIARLAAAQVGFAVVSSERIDRRADLGFERTHAAIAAYLSRCFTPARDTGTPLPHIRVLIASGSPCAPE